MRVKALLEGCDYRVMKGESGILDGEVAGIAYDSRQVKENYLFVAIRGEKVDGHMFVDDAVAKGARVVVAERDAGLPGCACVLVGDSRRALACIANNFYGRPSEDLFVAGVTGTNGKTTTTHILKSILEAWGKYVGMIGTIRHMVRDRSFPALHTTPESVELQELLREMVREGCTHVVAEVSSHALAQHRVDGVVFRAAVFTNLTRDHLDFHGTMEEYFEAKKRLFTELLHEDASAVVNTDDAYGKRLAALLESASPARSVITCGVGEEARMRASDIQTSFDGVRFRLSYEGRRYDVASALIGTPNVYNILSAAAAAVSMGVPWDDILEGIGKTRPVAGRFERIDEGQPFLCLVDYAHTEDALERLIVTARELLSSARLVGTSSGSGRIITVFGCGGDRDQGKRPRMGEIATRLSDFAIITSDNPRSENPLDIIKQIEDEAVSARYLVEPDRRIAIQKAVEMAGDGDMVLVAGKGHEEYQEISGVRYPFSDVAVLRESIRRRYGGGGAG